MPSTADNAKGDVEVEGALIFPLPVMLPLFVAGMVTLRRDLEPAAREGVAAGV